MEYTDCVLQISDAENVVIEYTVDGANTKVRGKMNDDPVIKLTIRRLNYWVNFGIGMQERNMLKNVPIESADLRAIGLNLYRMLFSDESIRNCFNEAYAQFEKQYQIEKAAKANSVRRMRLRLVFEQAAKDLGEFPWELLYIPGIKSAAGVDDIERGFFFAGEKTELVLTRYVPSRENLGGPFKGEPKAEPLRILVAVCNPDAGELPPIYSEDVEIVLSQIKALRNAEVERLDNPTYSTLFNALDRDPPWHIFHFIGHGRPGEVALIMEKEHPNYEEDKPRQPCWYKSETFNSLFTGHSPNLIFLHACKGSVDGTREGFNSIARELVYAEIPAVVAMQYNISGYDASRFARKFYEELGKGSDIDEAVKQGRLTLGRQPPQWEHPRFGTPVVIMQRLKNLRAMVLPAQNEEQNKQKQLIPGTPLAPGRGSLAGVGPVSSTEASEASEVSQTAPASTRDSVRLP